MLDLLLRASVEGTLLVAAIWVVVRAYPRLSASARAALWWCAAAKFVISLAWVAPIEIPLLPAAPAAGAVITLQETDAPAAATGLVSEAAAPLAAGGGARNAYVTEVRGLLLMAWCAGLSLTLIALASRWARTARLMRLGAAAPPHLRTMTADLCARLGIAHVPEVRLSPLVQTPMVAGFRRPTVLLPDRFTRLPWHQQQMAICHELTHVRRGDLWLGCVPALAERLFFFHPLAHVAAREYVFWRESACDASVLQTLNAAPGDYGRLLLDLGVASPRTSLAAAGASWSFSNLKRRIDMLGDLPRASTASRLLTAAAVLLAVCAAAPLRIVARAPVPAEPQAAPAPAATPAATPEPARAVAPQAPATERPVAPARQRVDRHDSMEPNYVLFFAGSGDERVHMSGSREDVDRARRFRQGSEPLLWFRDQRGEFVIRDPALLKQVETAWAPVAKLGEEQGRLGAEQGRLGARMGEFGAKQGALGAQQGLLGAKQAELGARQAQLSSQEWNASESRRAEIDKARRALESDMRALEKEMNALSDRMREFDKPMRELGAEMETLGREMKRRGEELQVAAERARAELRSLLDRAIASGLAQPAK